MNRTVTGPHSVAANADSDAGLMCRYGQGEVAAFEDLYARHKGPLFRYFLRQCRRAPLADELFQETWLKVVRARGKYRPEAKFATWLYAIAHNVLMDNFRRHAVAVVEGEDAEAAMSDAAAPEVRQPEREVDRRRRIEKLLALIDGLPVLQREAFLLHEEAGLTLAEIASVTGTNHETVKSRLRYALAKLRAGLDDEKDAGDMGRD